MFATQGVHPSYKTVRNWLLEVGLEKRTPKVKPLISRPHITLRLVFAQRHTDDDWRNNAFHDEKKFHLRRYTKAVGVFGARCRRATSQASSERQCMEHVDGVVSAQLWSSMAP